MAQVEETLNTSNGNVEEETAPQELVRPPAPKKKTLKLHGYLDEPVFQQCVEASQYLNAEYDDLYHITPVRAMGFEYERERDRIIAKTGAKDASNLRVIVYDEENGEVVSGSDFIADILATTNFRLFNLPDSDPQSYRALARASLKNHLAQTGCSFAWLLVKIDGMVAGRIVVQLFSNICPKTCLNFLHLCRGDLPDAKDADGKPVKLHYKGSKFYRVVKNGWVQGGDITGDKNGNGGVSIYGRQFPDESFDVKHEAGTLGMANDGEHTNASSFYITMKRNQWMDQRYVAFGRVVEGLNVVQAIHDVETKHNQAPAAAVVIDDCGDIPLDG